MVTLIDSSNLMIYSTSKKSFKESLLHLFSHLVYPYLLHLPFILSSFLAFLFPSWLKGNEYTHPLPFIRRDAGLCLLMGQLPTSAT